MKTKVKKNIKIIKIIISILIILNIINNIKITPSIAKYYKEGDSLVYNNKLINLNQNFSLDLTIEHASLNEFKANANFERNNVSREKELDKYIISSDAKDCKYEIMSIKDGKSNITNSNTISYDEPNANERIQVTITCPIESVTKEEAGEKVVKLNVSVTEQINDEEFIYQKGSLSMSLDEYNKEYNESNNPLTFTVAKDENLQKNIIEAIKKYDYYTEMEYYIEKNVNGNTINTEIKGLTIVDNEDSYTITVNDDFKGYAKTFYAGATPKLKDYIYFSSTDATSLNEAFKYYLETYFFEDDPSKNEKINTIINYINTFKDGIKYLVIDKGEIPGFYYIYEGQYELDTDKLYKAAIDYFNTKTQEKISIYLETKYSNISSNIKNVILKKDSEIMQSIIDHQNNETLKDDYYPILDNNTYNIIAVTSNKEEPIIINELEGISKDINLEFTNTNDNLNIKLNIDVPIINNEMTPPSVDTPKEEPTPDENIDESLDNTENNPSEEENIEGDANLNTENILSSAESKETELNEEMKENNSQEIPEISEIPESKTEGEITEKQNSSSNEEETSEPNEKEEDYTEYKNKLINAANILSNYFGITINTDSINLNNNTLTLSVTINKTNININYNNIIYKKEDY